MPIYFSSLWGADPNSDIIRLAKSYIKARSDAGLLLVPVHPVFNIDRFSCIDFRDDERRLSDANLADSVTPMSEFIKSYFSDLLNHKSRIKNRPDELLIQIDNVHAQIDEGAHAPAPLNYYRYVLETRYWKKVTLVNWGDENNLISEKLFAMYPKINKFEGSLVEAWQLLMSSSNAVIGSNILSQVLSQCVHDERLMPKRIWVPSYALQKGFLSTSNREVNSVEIRNYFSKFEWRSSRQQRDRLLNHAPSDIIDSTHWKFTETERCRSFQFCQSCRDQGPIGKLWRKVIQQRFDVPKQDWDCPHGWKWGGKPGLVLRLKKKFKLGTIIKNTTTSLGVRSCLDCVERGKRFDGDRH
ncbi:MAG: hypothetical protein ACI8XV_000200 [Arenicella sp.]|jgi:hypothetical protein